MSVAKDLSVIELADANGERRRLGDFWVDRPAVVAFVRHFG